MNEQVQVRREALEQVVKSLAGEEKCRFCPKDGWLEEMGWAHTRDCPITVLSASLALARAPAPAGAGGEVDREGLKAAVERAEKDVHRYMVHAEVGWLVLTDAQRAELRRLELVRDVLCATLSAQSQPGADAELEAVLLPYSRDGVTLEDVPTLRDPATGECSTVRMWLRCCTALLPPFAAPRPPHEPQRHAPGAGTGGA